MEPDTHLPAFAGTANCFLHRKRIPSLEIQIRSLRASGRESLDWSDRATRWIGQEIRIALPFRARTLQRAGTMTALLWIGLQKWMDRPTRPC